jgi:hypothetical protein
MNDNTVGLMHRGACIASKLGSYRSCVVLVGADSHHLKPGLTPTSSNDEQILHASQ